MIAGDGEGIVDAADVGLLDGAGDRAVLRLVSTAREAARRAERRHGARCSPTRIASRRARWTSVRDNLGVTEQPGENARSAKTRATRGSTCSRRSADAARSTMDQRGVEWATATSYGNTITYTPEDARRARVRRRRRDRVAGWSLRARASGRRSASSSTTPSPPAGSTSCSRSSTAPRSLHHEGEAPVRRQGHDRRRSRRLFAHTDGADVVVRLPDLQGVWRSR